MSNYAKYTGISGGGGSSGVTSVAFSDGSTTPIYTVTGSPVTTSGTITETLKTQTANTIFSGPTTGAAAQPTFRSLVTADMPAGVITSYTPPTLDTGTNITLSNAGTGYVLRCTYWVIGKILTCQGWYVGGGTPVAATFSFNFGSIGTLSTTYGTTHGTIVGSFVRGYEGASLAATNPGPWVTFVDGTNNSVYVCFALSGTDGSFQKQNGNQLSANNTDVNSFFFSVALS